MNLVGIWGEPGVNCSVPSGNSGCTQCHRNVPVAIQGVQMSLCLLMGIWGIPGITTGFQWEFRVYWMSLWGSSWNLGLYPVSP